MPFGQVRRVAVAMLAAEDQLDDDGHGRPRDRPLEFIDRGRR